MPSITSAVLALTAGLLLWFFSRLYVMRRRMRGLPGPPHHPLLGHLLIARDCVSNFPADAHAHVYTDYIARKYQLKKFFYIDFWPFGDQFLMITDPDIANQITIASSLPKSPLETIYMGKLLGFQNMVGLEGAAWRAVRTMFNPGFAMGHLMTLVPYIVDAAVVFGEVLREKADKKELFEMEEVATRLTVDIIGKVTLDVDLNSQRGEHRIVTAFRKQVELMPVTTPANPFLGLKATLLSPALLWYNGRKLDRYIGEALDDRYAKRFADEKSTAAGGTGGRKKTRYAVDLALDCYERDFQDPCKKKKKKKPGNGNGGRGRGGGMDPTFRQSAIDQIKTFIFAGHDTTSSTIAWIFYLLHRHPDIHAKVVEELDRVLGPVVTTSSSSSSSAAEKLRTTPHLLHRLPYTTATIKETLRLFPPASTVRHGSPSVTIFDPDQDPPHSCSSSSSSSQQQQQQQQQQQRFFPTATFHVWPTAHAIHRNAAYFPNPTAFMPERHLDHDHDATTTTTTTEPDGGHPSFPDDAPRRHHRDAFRPFEKGPRNCIGQELAMLELRVIVALGVREFDFEEAYAEVSGEGEGMVVVQQHGEMEGRDGKRLTIEGHRCYQVLKGSAKPKGGLPGRVRCR